MRKRAVPIVSGNVKYLGMTVPEWCMFLAPMGFYVIVVPAEAQWIVMLVHLAVIIGFIVFVSKIEENIIMVLVQNLQLPSVISGYFRRPVPVKNFITASDGGLSANATGGAAGKAETAPADAANEGK